ncbi:MAG TPA: nuclear transport factor 2 family protein [Chthonomonadales bacterium]|nr:nuclear transport factor 2 family protein [Chthonomonadales bacterium]
MKTIHFMLVSVLVGAVAAARADGHAVRKTLNALYADQFRAMEHKDLKGAMADVTGDFTFVYPGHGTINRKQAETEMRILFASEESAKMTYVLDSVQVHGSSAVVVITEAGSFLGKDLEGRLGARGKVHRIADKSRSRDEWIKTSGGWKCRKSTVLSDRMTVDGKPFQRQ